MYILDAPYWYQIAGWLGGIVKRLSKLKTCILGSCSKECVLLSLQELSLFSKPSLLNWTHWLILTLNCPMRFRNAHFNTETWQTFCWADSALWDFNVFDVEPRVCSWTLTCRWSVSRVCLHPCGRCPSDCRPEPSDTERNPYRWSYTSWLLHQDTGPALGNTHTQPNTHTEKINWTWMRHVTWSEKSSEISVHHLTLNIFCVSLLIAAAVGPEWDRDCHLSVSVTDSGPEYYPSHTQSYRQLRFHL